MVKKPSVIPNASPAVSRNQRLVDEVKAGLRETPKRISPVWFYDEVGSSLFDAICELPEYYITRTELAIMQAHADDMARLIGAGATVIEYGSGTSLKTRLLLDRLAEGCRYVPVDIARTHLLHAAQGIARDYPKLQVTPVCADFTQPFSLPADLTRRVVYFPGSTLGNFERDAACKLLAGMRKLIGADGAVLIGLDLKKDVRMLERAYDDAAGVTARFNLNALRHLNRELGANFDLTGFKHAAVWVEEFDRIEMRLIGLRPQTVTLQGEQFALARDEYLHTECSHKYTLESFADMAAGAGFDVEQVWMDDDRYFSIQWLEPR